jgi:hydrogenase-1 operon protein HyaF
MTRLADIAVRVEDDLTIGSVRAIGHEIVALLARLAATGEAGAIDLKSLPVGSEDRARLMALLGDGEVSAVVEALGGTRVRETRYPGVWWVTHENSAGDVIAEFIEVTAVPEILRTPVADLAAASAQLRARLDAPADGADRTTTGDSHGGS